MRAALPLLVVLIASPAPVHAEVAFACIRIARAQAGAPSAPTIALPAGYRLRDETGSVVAAPGEYHVFISGPRGTARASMSWPGVAIAAVIEGDAYLPLAGDASAGAVSCAIPVREPTMHEAWTTLDVATYLDESDLAVRVDHNHPGRRAGWYLDHDWPAGAARAAVNWIFAARLVVRDWGLQHRIAAAGKGHLSILGFESVNPLHLDFPPHWHLIDYWPGDVGTPVAHYYLDERGAITQDKIQILDREGQVPDRFLGPGQPMVYPDPDGATRFVTEIRPDGGLDIGPTEGQWLYGIVPGDDRTFTNTVTVLKDGVPFATVSAVDDVAQGVLTVRVRLLAGGTEAEEVHTYDPLTGAPRAATVTAPEPVYGISDPNAPSPALGHGAGSSGGRCGLGAAMVAVLVAALARFGWLRVAAQAVGSGAAVGWRFASSRLRSWSGRRRTT